MSVSAYIPHPENEEEFGFNVPVASEAFFKAYWEPAAEELNLQWVPIFSTGIDVSEEDLPDVLDELNRLKQWAAARGGEEMEQMLGRIDLLITQLPQAYRREGAVVYIG
ncbi:hypothetical protein [Paenibacillus mendelii]|uniref:Uncharacterized protein n=1 Tax=Paenibacillus mendelii TaxID=206163 RepID=A0ABV6J9W2_9BACL|nr:hypothetical protein [Paenibacillus mendelii]MCQ6560968.1 hypothetical protein [Paenibacillus mendelii]